MEDDGKEVFLAEMWKKGHDRTAEECRTETKSLKRKFKEENQKANRSGSGTMDMPFFYELQKILEGDASIEPKLLTSSSEVIWVHAETTEQGQEGSETSTSQENPIADSQELFSQDKNAAQDPDQEVQLILEEMDPQVLLEDVRQLESQTAGTSSESSGTNSPATTSSATPSSSGSNACAIINDKAVMTPAKRLACIRRRKVKETAATAVDKFIKHSSAQMSTLMTFLGEQWRQEQELEREAMQKNLESMEALGKIIAEEGESFRRIMEKLSTSLDTQTQILQNMCAIISSRGLRRSGPAPKRRRPSAPLVSKSQPTPTAAGDSQRGETATLAEEAPGPSSQPIRKIKKQVPLSP